jgi:mannose-6-phosphate isomerase-like protein (cupin superfamily)
MLEPGEKFEHFHSDESLTELVSGQAVLSLPDRDIELEVGKPVSVPAGVSHTLVNIGQTEACIGCKHGQ